MTQTQTIPFRLAAMVALLCFPAMLSAQVPIISGPAAGSGMINASTSTPQPQPQPMMNAGAAVGNGSYFDNCNSCTPQRGGRLAGLIKPSDHCFDCFVSPMTNPLFFEDPRTLTEARVIFANHNVPAAAAGGSVQFFAVQFRLALTQRLSFIANKDGYIISSNPLIDDGWADVAAGFKYNLIRDTQNQRLTSVGFTFDLPVGSTRSLQGNGDGELHLFTSSARRLTQNVNWMSGGGIRIPMNDNQESGSTYMSQHLDVRLTPRTFLLAEANWYRWYSSGNNVALAGVEGLDLFNFGSTGVSKSTGMCGLSW